MIYLDKDHHKNLHIIEANLGLHKKGKSKMSRNLKTLLSTFFFFLTTTSSLLLASSNPKTNPINSTTWKILSALMFGEATIFEKAVAEKIVPVINLEVMLAQSMDPDADGNFNKETASYEFKKLEELNTLFKVPQELMDVYKKISEFTNISHFSQLTLQERKILQEINAAEIKKVFQNQIGDSFTNQANHNLNSKGEIESLTSAVKYVSSFNGDWFKFDVKNLINKNLQKSHKKGILKVVLPNESVILYSWNTDRGVFDLEEVGYNLEIRESSLLQKVIATAVDLEDTSNSEDLKLISSHSLDSFKGIVSCAIDVVNGYSYISAIDKENFKKSLNESLSFGEKTIKDPEYIKIIEEAKTHLKNKSRFQN